MNEGHNLDRTLDLFLVVRLTFAAFGFLIFCQKEMLIPGYLALLAVCAIVFHIIAQKHVTHNHVYYAAMCTWASAVISVLSNSQNLLLITLFCLMYLNEFVVFRKWGCIYA